MLLKKCRISLNQRCEQKAGEGNDNIQAFKASELPLVGAWTVLPRQLRDAYPKAAPKRLEMQEKAV